MKKNFAPIAKMIFAAAFFSVLETAAQTTITSYTPTSGCPCSSQTITINGTGFSGTTSVAFGNAPATFTVVSATQITTTVPCAATTGYIQVVSTSGTGTSANYFIVHPLNTVSVSIAAVAPSPATGIGPFNVCNTIYAFQATPTNAGTAPIYQWFDGITPIGTNSSILTYSITQNSTISCVLTYGGSGVPCPTNNPATSNTIVFICTATSIAENSRQEHESILLSPNPAINEITVQSLKFKIESVEVFDVMGQRVIASPLNPLKGISASTVIDVSSLASGIYFVKLRGEKEERVGKFMKQ